MFWFFFFLCGGAFLNQHSIFALKRHDMELLGGMMLGKRKCTSIKLCGSYKITIDNFYNYVPQLNLTDFFCFMNHKDLFKLITLYPRKCRTVCSWYVHTS